MRDQRGAAAAEFALALPMMLALLFGAMEAGHYFWTQHKIVKAVRDGVRYASRLDINALCDGTTNVMSNATRDAIRSVTVTGQVASGGVPKVPGWDSTTVDVTVTCAAFVDTGIYTELGNGGALVTIASGAVRYPSIFSSLGFIDSNFRLSARSSSAVMGI